MKQKILAEIERRMKCFKNERNTITKASDNNLSLGARIAMCEEILSFINSLPEEPVSDVKTRVKEIFDSCEKIDVSDGEKNRVAFGLLELEGFAKIFYKMGKQEEEPDEELLTQAP